MQLTVRSCRPEEMNRYGEILAYVFAENSAENIRRELEATDPSWTHCAFDGDYMVGTMGVFPFTVQLNGRPTAMGGVTGVGTLPEYRRKGVLRNIMTSGLEVMKERGQSIAILWASMGAIYQRFGYGLAAPMVIYDYDPRDVRLERGPAPSGSCRMTPRDEAEPVLRAIYERFLEGRNLVLHRNDFFWENGLRSKEDKPKYIAIYRDGAGEPTGYVVYSTKEGDGGLGPSQQMNVHDFIACDVDAWAGIWEYIRGHDLVGKVVMRGVVAEDDFGPDLLSEPRMLNRWSGDAIWMRITDIEAALAARPYPVDGRLLFTIPEDGQCPWNAGIWTLEVNGGEATVSRSSESAAMAMPVNSLAGLLSGYRTATQLHRAGRIECQDPATLQRTDAMFATAYRPFLPNEF